jgi:hypothetical protein
MWWIVAIMPVRAIFLPTQLFGHESDKVLHNSSRLSGPRMPHIREYVFR